jgi:hypothetical protein
MLGVAYVTNEHAAQLGVVCLYELFVREHIAESDACCLERGQHAVWATAIERFIPT